MDEPPASTPTRPIRVPIVMWEAYGRVCTRLGTDRTNDLHERMREQIRAHGTKEDLAALAQGEQELADRRARMHRGRPRKEKPEE